MKPQGTFSQGSILDEKYTITLFVKKGTHAETYRVKGRDGKLYFLKLFNVAQLHRTAFDANGGLLEVELLRRVNHPNVVSYKDSGEVVADGKRFIYAVYGFIAGETLAERLAREPISTIYDVRQILGGVLNALTYLHNFPEPIVHNEITPQNIMLDMSADTPQAKIIDFGYARSFCQSSKTFNREGLNLHFVASECITAGAFSPQSDLFSVGAVLYQMLYGMLPWSCQISPYIAAQRKVGELILEARERPLMLPDISGRFVDFDVAMPNIVQKALSINAEMRFQSAAEFLQALNGEIQVAPVEASSSGVKQPALTANAKNALGLPIEKKRGKGFAAIVGMNNLKEMLQNDVINVIRHPEEYRRHHLGLPNGMLLYGPPGCGKTFFAERFAEEAGHNFIKVLASDIASIYVHGTQEKIGKLFKEAREKAPTILYFDELDAMVPDRQSTQVNGQSGEVNEFLSQLDNVGDSGVFVIGSTNKPELIDKAILRAGRLEKHFYIPPPDFEARRAMFEMYLKDRPLDFGIDYTKLATLTESYVSGDIKLLVDEASRKTIRDGSKHISMATLEYIIAHQRPTISLNTLKKFENARAEFEGIKPKWPKIGF